MQQEAIVFVTTLDVVVVALVATLDVVVSAALCIRHGHAMVIEIRYWILDFGFWRGSR